MKYMGSKNRIAKDILPIILKGYDADKAWYVEPFVGGANAIDKVPGKKKIGADSNRYLIALWQGLRKGRIGFVRISKDMYNRARQQYRGLDHTEPYTDFQIGWIGFMGSYNGRFFDGGYSGHDVNGRDYIREQIDNTLLQLPNLYYTKFVYSEYQNLHIPKGALIYCDPPYKGTKQYDTSKNFNHDLFWQWVRDKVQQGHKVYVSEYQAPPDFVCVWSKEINNTMHQKNTHKPIEKLFVHVDQYLAY